MKLKLFAAYQNDEALMRMVSKGDHQAFTVLYERYADKLYTYFVKMLWKNTELASDKTQQLFLTVWEKSNSFDPAVSFPESWPDKIGVKSLILNYQRYEENQVHRNTNYWHFKATGVRLIREGYMS